MACCPAHHDHNPSLAISEGINGKVLVHCHAGCSQEKVIGALKALGFWVNHQQKHSEFLYPKKSPTDKVKAYPENAEKKAFALAIWKASIPIQGTIGEVYLKSRGLSLSPPSTLRFYVGLPHPSGGYHPAIVALVTRDPGDEPVGILRTFLAEEGLAKAPVNSPKMMLGPCNGGAVRLAEPAGELMVGEGIETCLSVMQMTGKPAWAALSTSGLKNVQLPPEVQKVIVLADGDQPGEKAARACAQRLIGEGRAVRIAHPPQGQDFNDMLMGGSAHTTGD